MDRDSTLMTLVVALLLVSDPCLGACPSRLTASRGQTGVTLAWNNGETSPTSVEIRRNGEVIAPAAPATPPLYSDTGARPGLIIYEVTFSMPEGDGCPSLTAVYDACITGLQAERTEAGAIVLSWANNLEYDGIDISRNGEVIEAAVSGATATYMDTAAPDEGTVTYAVAPTNGTCAPAVVEIDMRCFLPAPECEVPAGGPDAELIRAFAFGVHPTFLPGEWCLSYNDDVTPFTPVEQISPVGMHYVAARGWGYEILYKTYAADPMTPYGNRSGYEIFGPFDSTVNDRDGFTDNTCPEELYDSFIGAKDFLAQCNGAIAGDRDTPCAEAPVEPPILPEGIIFRVDVPNGRYRFVAAVGSVKDRHAHRIVAEDGGSGPPEQITPNHVVLVSNFDQAQYATGEVASVSPNLPGLGVFARVGFDGLIPPPGDGVPPSPQFINMDEDGMPTSECPNSPTLTVTHGSIRFHQLQGNSNDGCGGPRDPDGNGGNVVVLEIWRVGSGTPPETFRRGDVNGEGGVDIADAVYILQNLFANGPPITCPDAADANDDEAVDLADAVYILQYFFAHGPAIPEPHPDCGTDPTANPDPGGEDLPPCTYDQDLCGADVLRAD